MDILYHPIGIIHTPFTDLREMPIQPSGATAEPGTAEVFPEFADGLKDLDSFSHVILIYHLHAVRRMDLSVTPFLGDAPHGIFATRAPTRPNPIGFSVVRLDAIDGHILRLGNVDILDATPLLDIKPYVPDFDWPGDDVRLGWLGTASRDVRSTRSDERFIGRRTADG
jgi:tRNA-Thr(GGU) m(6)t(6)A37 methyltransferase TsaA